MKRFAFLLCLLLCFSSGCGTSPVTSSAKTGGKISGSFTGCMVGAYVDGMGNIDAFEAKIGKNLAVVLCYVHWQNAFPSAEADIVQANGSIPLITWEPWISHETGTLEAIAAGAFEPYVRSFIQSAKDWGHPVFLRFAHEMNGNWYPWDGQHNGEADGPVKYKRAWIYIHNIVQEIGATNITLVWCPNNTNLPVANWNNIAAYYPGDDYVDWVGMDGYNWGYGSWESFSQVFGDVYSHLIILTNKPIMVGEFAAAEQGGDKAAWIADACSTIKNNYSHVKMFCWFNTNKERDWRIESSVSAEAALKNSLQDTYFLGRM
ncbi:MAG: glycosyl hydrolase [Candidatus Margulisiibacteriota bacterium]